MAVAVLRILKSCEYLVNLQEIKVDIASKEIKASQVQNANCPHKERDSFCDLTLFLTNATYHSLSVMKQFLPKKLKLI